MGRWSNRVRRRGSSGGRGGRLRFCHVQLLCALLLREQPLLLLLLLLTPLQRLFLAACQRGIPGLGGGFVRSLRLLAPLLRRCLTDSFPRSRAAAPRGRRGATTAWLGCRAALGHGSASFGGCLLRSNLCLRLVLLLKRDVDVLDMSPGEHLVLGVADGIVAKLVKVHAVVVVAGEIAQKVAAVLGGAQRCPQHATVHAEVVDAANATRGSLRLRKGHVGAVAGVLRVAVRGPVHNHLEDLAVLPKVFVPAERCLVGNAWR